MPFALNLVRANQIFIIKHHYSRIHLHNTQNKPHIRTYPSNRRSIGINSHYIHYFRSACARQAILVTLYSRDWVMSYADFCNAALPRSPNDQNPKNQIIQRAASRARPRHPADKDEWLSDCAVLCAVPHRVLYIYRCIWNRTRSIDESVCRTQMCVMQTFIRDRALIGARDDVPFMNVLLLRHLPQRFRPEAARDSSEDTRARLGIAIGVHHIVCKYRMCEWVRVCFVDPLLVWG